MNAEGLRKQIRRGDYNSVIALYEGLPPMAKDDPVLALEVVRAFLMQGRVNRAGAKLAAPPLLHPPPHLAPLVEMERCLVLALEALDFDQALIRARAAYAEGRHQLSRPALARAARLEARIILIARTYMPNLAREAERTFHRLKAAAHTAERAGEAEEAALCRLLIASALTGRDHLYEALHQCERAQVLAEAAGLPALAAEAELKRAQRLVADSDNCDEARAVIAKARARYAACAHRHGIIDAELQEIALDARLGRPVIDRLDAAAEYYREIGYVRGEIDALSSRITIAHHRGEAHRCISTLQRHIAVAEEAGLGVAVFGAVFSLGDLLTRAQRHTEAIDLYRAQLDRPLPPMLQGMLKQMLATSYSFAGDEERAVTFVRAAHQDLLAAGARDAASSAVWQLANLLSSGHSQADSDEAERLLNEAREQSRRAGDHENEATHLSVLAQTILNRSARLGGGRVAEADAQRIEEIMTDIETLAARLPEPERAKRMGNLLQLRGQMASQQGDESTCLACWEQAEAHYDAVGLQMEAANCNYIIGCMYLNRANVELPTCFGRAETALQQAMEYYDQAGLRTQAADARHMLALLYKNASLQTPSALGAQLRAAAVDNLQRAAEDLDDVRREYALADSRETQDGKLGLAAKAERVFQLGFELLVLAGDGNVARAWTWLQAQKCRALGDLLGDAKAIAARFSDRMADAADARAQVEEDVWIGQALKQARGGDRAVLRDRRARLRETMAADPRLEDYLEIATGRATDWQAAQFIVNDPARGDRRVVICDYVTVGNRTFAFVFGSGDDAPRLHHIPIDARAILNRLQYLFADPETTRLVLRDSSPPLFKELSALIAPALAESAPGDILVFCPCRPLHVLPLHALPANNGEPLLVRNPVTYAPSLGVLRSCHVRRQSSAEWSKAAIFGNPTGDRADGLRLVQKLGDCLGVEPILGAAVTRAAFREMIAGKRLVHVHSHAEFDDYVAMDSCLILGDGSFTAWDIFGLTGVDADLVTLASCRSGVVAAQVADEPLGLLRAFLFAGAHSILASLWQIWDLAATELLTSFYDALLSASLPKVIALQRASLNLRALDGRKAPYYWAGFVLFGDWL